MVSLTCADVVATAAGGMQRRFQSCESCARRCGRERQPAWLLGVRVESKRTAGWPQHGYLPLLVPTTNVGASGW
jgi:hypothetical protein